jgi:hypothetical protein
MTTRSNGPLAGFGWLKHGISLSFRHPKALLGGAAFLVIACLLPLLIMIPMQIHMQMSNTQASMATFGWIKASSMLLGLLIVPLYAGYLQMVDAAERGLPAHALDIFKPYRQGDALRVIGYGLLMLIVYVAMLGVVIVATGGGIVSWYGQLLSAQASHLPPPSLPQGFGITMALFVVLGIFNLGVYAISLGQVALRKRSAFAAVGDGLSGALKNLLPLIVFVVSVIIAWMIMAIAIVLVALLITFLAKLVGAWLAIVLIIPLYAAMMLIMFAVMFGVMYYLWRDVCGDASVMEMPSPLTA